MKSKVLLIWLAMLLFVAGSVKAQTMHPKREFRGAWIQCVNGQFQGMPILGVGGGCVFFFLLVL